MTRLLLDTHILLWADEDSSRLGASVRAAILRAEEVYVSAASEWEVAIKASLGRISLERTVLQATLDAGFTPLDVMFSHTRAVAHLPAIHGDPFDRLLIAVAQVENLILVTADPQVRMYPIATLAT